MKLFFLILFQVYGFPVNQLFDMLLEIRDQYSGNFAKEVVRYFRRNYLQLSVCGHACLYTRLINNGCAQATSVCGLFFSRSDSNYD